MKILTFLILGTTPFTLSASARLPATPAASPINVPATVFTALPSFHIQARLHGVAWSGSVNSMFQAGGYGISSGGGVIAFVLPDPNVEGAGNCDINMKNAADVTIGITRDLTASTLYPNGLVRGEAFLTATGALLGTCVFTISQPGGASGVTIRNNGISVGASGATGSIDFVRWFNGAVPAGTAIPAYVAAPAPWLDLEFPASGTGNDNSAYQQSIAGALTFASSPTYQPVCNPGTSQTVIAGKSMTLNGGNSYALAGGAALTYAWSYPGPGSDGVGQSPIFSDTSAVGPTVTGLATFGSFNSQLIVTDSNGTQSVCTVHNGVVAAAANGAINLTAEGLNPVQQYIVGPQVASGMAAWPWIDVAVANELNLQLSNLQTGGIYEPYWRTLQAGSISFSAGSSIVTGSGTAFRSLFCSGGSVSDGSYLTWRYPGTDSLTHYGQFQIASCIDDTHMVVSASFNGSPVPFVYPAAPKAPWPVCTTSCSGLGYGRADTSGIAYNTWVYSPAPGNYYDNVMFFLVGYWRSGIDTFYQGAQTLSTYWMEWPNLDYYYNCNYEVNNYQPGNTPGCPGESRSLALTGMALWEQQPGNSFLLPALENAGQKYLAYAGNLPTFIGLNDMRDDAYVFAGLATLALIETDSTRKRNYQSVIDASLGTLWTPFQRHSPYVGWNQFYFGYQNSVIVAGGAGSVSVFPGSTTVTGQGTSFNSSLLGTSIWTFPSPAGTVPPYCGACFSTGSAVGGDAHSYVITGVDPVAQTLTISEPYAGTNNLTARGFATGGGSGIVGWGFQPFMMGLLGTAFFLDAQAMAGYDATAQTAFLNYGHEAVNLLTTLITPDQGGFYNGAYFPGCAPPMYASSPLAQLYCYGTQQYYQGSTWNSSTTYNVGVYAIYNGVQYVSLQSGNVGQQPSPSGGSFWLPVTLAVSPGANRQLTAESMRAFSFDYQFFGTNAATATQVMSQMFSKPGTGGPNPDGYYLTGYDLTTLPPGFYVGGGDPKSKWAGQLAGFSEGAVTWPGTVASMTTLPVTTSFLASLITGTVRLSGRAIQ